LWQEVVLEVLHLVLKLVAVVAVQEDICPAARWFHQDLL
jgi:hypothetical protein